MLRKEQRLTGGDQSGTRLMRIQRFINGHYGHPNRGYVKVYEKECGKKGDQKHGHHGVGTEVLKASKPLKL